MENICSPHWCIQFKYLKHNMIRTCFFFFFPVKARLQVFFKSIGGEWKMIKKKKSFKSLCSVIWFEREHSLFQALIHSTSLIFLSQQKLIALSSFEKSKRENTKAAIFRNQWESRVREVWIRVLSRRCYGQKNIEEKWNGLSRVSFMLDICWGWAFWKLETIIEKLANSSGLKDRCSFLSFLFFFFFVLSFFLSF